MRKEMRRPLAGGLLALAAAGAAVWAVASHVAGPPTPALVAQTRGGWERGADGPIRVVAGTVGRKDVDIFLDGLGSVAAYNTVTIKSRVDGQLQQLDFREGQEVHAGDVLAQIDPRPFQATLRQMQAALQRDQAQLVNAKLDLDRFVKLADYASRQSVDTQRAKVGQLDGAIAADQAQIDSAKVQLDYATIRSPIDGRTGIRLVDAGNIIHAGDATGIVVITQLRPISVLFTLPEQSLSAVNKQLADHRLKVLAFDRDNQSRLGDGLLELVDNMIDATTGTIKLKATFANDDLSLWPGQFVNVRLQLTTRKDGVVVPAQVVQRGPQGPYAFVVRPDSTVEMRPIRLAQIEAGTALVDDGLEPGERVVVEGQYKLQPGSKVDAAAAVEPSASAGPDAPGRAARGPRS